MIFSQPVKCPYCGYERMHSWDPTEREYSKITCTRDSHHEGCGRQALLDWHLCAVAQVRKIEGQEEQKAAE